MANIDLCEQIRRRIENNSKFREYFKNARLNPDFVAIVEMTHVELAGGNTIVVAVRPAVDIETTHTAYTLAAVVVEANGESDIVVGQFLVEDVEHLKEGAVGRDVLDLIGLKATLGLGILLSPDMKC